MSFHSELQKAVYARLNTGLTTPVYDSPPQDAAFPYVTIGDTAHAPFDTDNSVGSEVLMSVHVWDNYNGNKRILGLLDEIYSLLNRQPLAVTGYNVLDVMYDASPAPFLDADGKTRHGVSTFRLLLDEV